MMRPSTEAISRKPMTMNSRPMMMTTIQACMRPISHQRNKCGGDQEFVGDGIEENSQCGYFFTLAGEVTVHHVGGRGDQQNQHTPNFKVNGQTQKIEIGLAGEQDDDKQGNKKDAQGRQTIRADS